MAKAFVAAMLATCAILIVIGCWKAAAMMEEERTREALRRATAAAMRTDAHLERLRRQRMRVRYRVAP